MSTDVVQIQKGRDVKELPPCVQRLGRVRDNRDGKHRAVMTCGGMCTVSLGECQSCGGKNKPMIKGFVEPEREDNA